jgi:negative regulator of sigma E activity
MTNDERISAYIDNELTADQEQELLISLAASDTLRKSFRSELVLKKVLRADERAVNPPRHLRTAVFAAIGLGAAVAATAEAEAATVPSAAASADAGSAPTHGLLKTLFASKVNALLTAGGLTVAGLAGYGVHTLTVPAPAPHEVVIPATTSTSAPVTLAPAVTEEEKPAVAESKPTVHRRAPHRAIQETSSVNTGQAASLDSAKPSGVSGGNTMTMDQIPLKKK